MTRTFNSEFAQVLDSLLRREDEERRHALAEEERWKAAVQEFRQVAADCIRPVLHDVQQPLRARGMHTYIGDNTRFGMSCWLDFEREGEPARGLSFRLDADRKVVEAIYQRPMGSSKLGERPLADIDRDWVQETLLTFIRQVYSY